MKAYDELQKKIQNRYKEVKIKYKSDYLFWQMLPEGLRCSGCVLGNTIWMPARTYNLSVLAHEYVHVVQQHTLGKLMFVLLYIMPQVLSFLFFITAIGLALFSLGTAALIVAALGLIPLGPWPAKKRLELEVEGYTMNLAVERWKNGKNSKQLQKFIVDSLIGWLYYKMTWNRAEVNKLVLDMVLKVSEGSSDLMNNIAYKDTYETIHNG